jgi:hypothetical protein
MSDEDKIYKNCPYFNEGCCTAFKINKCKYMFHNVCTKNYLCRSVTCSLGHGIPFTKREIINDIYCEKYDLVNPNNEYENSTKQCEKPINCINEDCTLDHHLEYEDRKFMYDYVINSEITYEDAKIKYIEKYESRSSTVMSSNTTEPSYSPCKMIPPPMLSAKYVPSNDTDTIDKLLDIRKEIETDTKSMNDIKNKIQKLKKELSERDEVINKNKIELKELVEKLANI